MMNYYLGITYKDLFNPDISQYFDIVFCTLIFYHMACHMDGMQFCMNILKQFHTSFEHGPPILYGPPPAENKQTAKLTFLYYVTTTVARFENQEGDGNVQFEYFHFLGSVTAI